MTNSEENIKLLQNELLKIKPKIINFFKLIKNENKNTIPANLEKNIKLIFLLEKLFKHYPNKFDNYYDNYAKRFFSYSNFISSFERIEKEIENIYLGLPFLNIPRFENIINDLSRIINNIIDLTKFLKMK